MNNIEVIILLLFFIICFLYGIASCESKGFREFMHSKIKLIKKSETDWEFPVIEAHIKQVEKNTGLHIERIRNYRPFDELIRIYGWPHSSGGWCTARKCSTIRRYMRAVKTDVCCIGFAADEQGRAEGKEVNNVKWKNRFPLIEAGFSQVDSLEYCYGLGYTWDGLYNHFSRVSCFCCPKAEKLRRAAIEKYFPELAARWDYLESIAKEKEEVKSEQLAIFSN